MDNALIIKEKIEHQNVVLKEMLGALNIYEVHPAADKKKFRMMRIRYAMLLEENELLISKLTDGTSPDKLEQYLRVPRTFLPAPSDTIDDGDPWKKPT